MAEAMSRIVRGLPSLLVGLLAFPPSLFAHRLDEYLQATIAVIEPTGIRLQVNLVPGVAVAEQILASLDHDGDGVISTNEATAYAELLKHDLTAQLDQANLDLKLTASVFPEPSDLRDGIGIIQLEFTAVAGPLTPGAHRYSLKNRHLPHVSVYLVNAAKPQSGSIQITRQKRNQNQSVSEIEFTVDPPVNASR